MNLHYIKIIIIDYHKIPCHLLNRHLEGIRHLYINWSKDTIMVFLPFSIKASSFSPFETSYQKAFFMISDKHKKVILIPSWISFNFSFYLFIKNVKTIFFDCICLSILGKSLPFQSTKWYLTTIEKYWMAFKIKPMIYLHNITLCS